MQILFLAKGCHAIPPAGIRRSVSGRLGRTAKGRGSAFMDRSSGLKSLALRIVLFVYLAGLRFLSSLNIILIPYPAFFIDFFHFVFPCWIFVLRTIFLSFLIKLPIGLFSIIN